ncbi:MAG: LolA-related protein [Gallionellaceae bacterium]|nr:LolA-related protein [Gallionellaceae bacterium]
MISGKNKFILAGLFLCIAGTSSAFAETSNSPPGKWGLAQLMQNLAQRKSAHARFVERKYMSILNAPLESSGTLNYAPGRLEKNTLLPKAESMVLEQDKLILENKAKKQRRTLVLQDYPLIWAFVEGIRSTLAGDLSTLSHFYHVSVEGNEHQWQLLLLPSEPKMQSMIREIRIGGKDTWVHTIEIIETGGDHSLMTITEEET